MKLDQNVTHTGCSGKQRPGSGTSYTLFSQPSTFWLLHLNAFTGLEELTVETKLEIILLPAIRESSHKKMISFQEDFLMYLDVKRLFKI